MERLICLAVGYVCGLLADRVSGREDEPCGYQKEGKRKRGNNKCAACAGMESGHHDVCGRCAEMCGSVSDRTYFMYRGTAIIVPLLAMYAGAGVTLGHNFPFYMKFKGGKGIAVMAGLVALNSFWHLPKPADDPGTALAFFLVPVIITRYISVGSLAAYTVFLIEMILMEQHGLASIWRRADCYELYAVLCSALTAACMVPSQGKYRTADATERKINSDQRNRKE